LSAFTSNASATDSIGSDSTSFSYLLGPFIRYKPTPRTTLAASFSAGRTDTDLTVGTIGTSATWSHEIWIFTPSANVYYSTSDTDSFTDSAGNVSGERSSDAGSVNIGPKFSYSHFVDNGGPIVMIQPTLRISGSYKYKNQGDTRFASGVILTDDKLSASVSPGIDAQLRNGSSADIGYTRSGLGTDVNAWSLTAGASAPVDRLFPG
jgi:outer membrane autotransporter protein